ncbi:DUF4383 domain-containing protein [Actinomycetospora sp. TBRC 11914]|uniref:DUF4383 domain-containing protein n=1 Tax=Actinomycetospora sp. TBRC 11914 TaxID=2729387 RepID=UPI00145F2E94|nr:DUF4383 domain-containing protein [Actinomycetospora sp. TBRC 11914]NMO94051.1 DUF4383 domain-containing protein [Actinomycetospora sp. TBRC 11914]
MTEQDQRGQHGPGTGSARRGEPTHPDAGSRSHHDEAGRPSGSPYVQSGRDEAGRPQPAVPHEGLLGRIASAVIAGQSVVLAVVAVAGYVVGSGQGFTGRSDATFLALRLNPAHSTILLVWAVLGVVALSRRKFLRAYTAIQAVGFLLLFAFGTAFSVATTDSTPLDLNTPDHVLHGVLFLLGFITMMISSARIVEPPPGPDPYPDAVEDDPTEVTRPAGHSPGDPRGA